tara:strand:+ start:196 stop:1077 length:882 start_codon:yes stop_codon:yes gene_type:complete
MDNKFPGKDISESDLKDKFPLSAKKSKNHFSKFKVCGVEFGGKKIPVMAGPNMVENLPMILKTARSVKKNGASFLRGGAYKPLTFPYRSKKYYETREQGIEWLSIVKKEIKIPIITEILDIRDIEHICEVTDIIQIGSRNMQNYPLLTECAKTMKPIMIKRHYGASLRDWLGAAEYILFEGNKKVMLCERGVSVTHTHRSTSRFLIDLQVVPAVKEISHLPIIVDPSHATFWRPWVKDMTLASIASGADGIMLEVHPDPQNSAVDPLQPISFKSFSKLMKQMKKVAKSIGRNI